MEGELDPATSLPAGWEVTQDPPNSYKVEVVDGGRSGKKCLRISGDGKNVQVRVKFLPMGPDHRSVCSGWMKYMSGRGMVSLIQRYQDADGQPLGSTRTNGYRLNAGQKASEWMQAASIDFPEVNPPGANANFVINGDGKFDALFDDLEVFTLAVTPDDLLWAKGHFEVHGFQNPNRRSNPSTANGGTGEVSRVDDRPASGRSCKRLKAMGDTATSSFEPKSYDPGRVYTLTGKVSRQLGPGHDPDRLLQRRQSVRMARQRDRRPGGIQGLANFDRQHERQPSRRRGVHHGHLRIPRRC